MTRALRALSEFRLEGVGTNIPFLQNILRHEDFAAGRIYTRWVDEHVAELASPSEGGHQRFVETSHPESGDAAGFAGARVDTAEPLARFDHDARGKAEQSSLAETSAEDAEHTGPAGSVGLSAPIQGTIVSLDVEVDQQVRTGQQLAVVEAMKMEYVIAADRDGIVRAISMAVGDVVREGFPIVFIEEAEVDVGDAAAEEELDLDYIRPDLQESLDRHAYNLDENRAEAVAKRRARGYRMIRENIAELVDPGSFNEYWPLVVAFQHQRHDMETLRKRTPADGVVAGIGTINGEFFDDERSRAMVVAYDYTVLAGTQGRRNHDKQDRLFELAGRFG